jgi:protein-disulfide isomerase
MAGEGRRGWDGMRQWRVAIRVFVLISFLLGSSAVAAQEVPWDKLPNVPADLSGSTKTRAAELMKQEMCYHGCEGTIFECVTKPDPDGTALYAAGFIARQVVRGKPSTEVTKALLDRARSVHPFKSAKLDYSTAVCLGSPNAPVVVAAFTDFECPFCRMVSPVLRKLATDREGKVAYCFKFFPVKGHGPLAVKTSKLGVAADVLGMFWGFHDVMYEHFEKHDESDITGYAKSLGLDWARMEEIAGGKETKQRVTNSKREGLKLGVKATPTVYVNGKLYHGEKSEVELIDRVEEELMLVR